MTPSRYEKENCTIWVEGDVAFKLYKNEGSFQLCRYKGSILQSWMIVPFDLAKGIGAEMVASAPKVSIVTGRR